MSILSLIDKISAEDLGKIILGEVNELVINKSKELISALMESELIDFLSDAVSAPEGDFRNGYYSRRLNTPMGPMDVKVPRDRLGKFRTKLLAPYQRSVVGISDMVQRLYVKGMSENEIVDHLMDEFGISMSRETIRKTVNKVIGDALSFNKRVIPDCAIVYLDGTYVPIKRRYEDTSKVEKECVMVALGITKSGKKEILGFYFTPNEGSFAWDDVLKDLYSRGLYSPAVFVTDGLQGMPEAIHRNFPMAKHQLCIVHQTRTICRDVRKTDRKEVSDDFANVYLSDSKEAAIAQLDLFLTKWRKAYPTMARKLASQTDLFTFMEFPRLLWRSIYTSNIIESFNSKLKRLTRKRIPMNSEENAVITISSACSSYNKNAGFITFRHFGDLGEDEKKGLFLPITD